MADAPRSTSAWPPQRSPRCWLSSSHCSPATTAGGSTRCCRGCSTSIWAFPVLLLGIALGTALSIGGLKLGPVAIAGDSIWIPILIIGLVYVPYMASPLRGEILALREKEFVEAAVAQGMGPLRIMFA